MGKRNMIFDFVAEELLTVNSCWERKSQFSLRVSPLVGRTRSTPAYGTMPKNINVPQKLTMYIKNKEDMELGRVVKMGVILGGIKERNRSGRGCKDEVVLGTVR